ncbi:hypothetical protein PR202_gn00453 [Eleusine coracana subsp. coracana]|uniref:Uncharacterized protein n=1 Tax=Eleusine coracana subsp. coracana TaxID=191504 RepID=A0AAV5G2L0_ELECO|nr:hypothetical protein PR202_gn00453 [Eleusine coracana subsp. coracana]
MAVETELGNGKNTFFWRDKWIMGQRLEDLSPLIYSMIPKRISNKRIVHDALTDMRWIQDIHGILTIEVSTQRTGDLQKALNLTVVLGVWTLWRYRNDCVFNGRSPNIASALTMAGEEKCLWSLAGAKAPAGLPTLGEESF